MAIKDIFKISRKTFFNPRDWLSYDYLKDQTRLIKTLVKDAATVQKPKRIETFEKALKRLKVKDAELQTTARTYFAYAILFLSLAIIDFIYGAYLLFHQGTFGGLVLALAVCVLLLTQAFRYHFWFFQIKQRKLGCSFEEWRDGFLGKTRTRKRKSS